MAADRMLSARPSAKVRSFACAPWKQVRIFEEIVGVLQDAHFPKGLRTYGPGAHLRRPALA
jgi:hypothetical protein